MKKTIVIIGAGMGGLASGIYGQREDYKTMIFEMHSKPGGQCAAWRREGYTFDACIHHLFGCSPETRINRLWRELGAMPREMVYPKECVSVAAPDGTFFEDSYDPDALEEHLMRLSPLDEKPIKEYVRAIEHFAGNDIMGEILDGTVGGALKGLPAILPEVSLFSLTMRQYAARFSSAFLRKAFALLEYSLPDAPFFLHLVKHGYGAVKDVAWPVGGSRAFARSIEERYRQLGGEVHYRQKVKKILVENGRAAGVRLADGTEQRADIVISDADGRRTILEMLDGKYMDEHVRRYCAEPPDETNWAVHVFLGVNRDLSKEPSALVMLLDRPAVIAGHEHRSLEMQLYGFDPAMAPEGKGVIKVELVSTYSYWKRLYADRQRYDEEKQKVAETVIDLLENRFPGIKAQVETVDVPTLMTWERYMGGTHGLANGPNKKFSVMRNLFGGFETALPGLSDFYFAGVWATATGALFANALSGKRVIKQIAIKDGKKFSATEI